LNHIEIYTDGACKGNPGPGGWGVLLKSGGTEKELFGGELGTTNNRMELTAVIRALEALKRPCQVSLHADSQYAGRPRAGKRRPGNRSKTWTCGSGWTNW
jgi:ribonuclease HI